MYLLILIYFTFKRVLRVIDVILSIIILSYFRVVFVLALSYLFVIHINRVVTRTEGYGIDG